LTYWHGSTVTSQGHHGSSSPVPQRAGVLSPSRR
jgi:hypothetical protein